MCPMTVVKHTRRFQHEVPYVADSNAELLGFERSETHGVDVCGVHSRCCTDPRSDVA